MVGQRDLERKNSGKIITKRISSHKLIWIHLRLRKDRANLCHWKLLS